MIRARGLVKSARRFSLLHVWPNPFQRVEYVLSEAHIADLRGLQQKLYLDGLVGEFDGAGVGLAENAGGEQRNDVAVHTFDVATYPAGGLTDGDRTNTTQRLEELPSLRREDLP